MIFRNARLVFTEGVRDGTEIVVEDGIIAAIRPASAKGSGGEIDLAGNFLAPGFIDVHVHGAMGRDVMEGSIDALRTICDYHATGGTTALLLTTATSPVDEILEVLRTIKANRQSLPRVAGVHVEGPFLSKEKAGAQRSEFIRDPDAETVACLLPYAEVIRRLTIAPELPGALEAIRSFSAAGTTVSGGHSNAWEEEARAGFECGMRSVTHTFNCMSSARHRGVEQVAGLLEFALSEPEITCEVIADGHHVSSTLMKMLLRAKGPAGVCLVTDATAGAGLPEGTAFSLAGRPCVVRGGVCLLADGSALAGSAARMIDLVRVMVRQIGLPLHEAVRMATEVPARLLGSQEKGRLKVGAAADFVVMSDDLEVTRTFFAGQKIFSR